MSEVESEYTSAAGSRALPWWEK